LAANFVAQRQASEALRFAVRIDAARDFETVRYMPGLATLVAPIEFSTRRAQGERTHAFNRLRLTGDVQASEVRHRDGRTGSGAIVAQRERNADLSVAALRADYALSPSAAAFAKVSSYWRTQTAPLASVPVNRNAHGGEAVGGVKFALAEILTGEVAAGALKQNCDAQGVPDANDFLFRGRL